MKHYCKTDHYINPYVRGGGGGEELGFWLNISKIRYSETPKIEENFCADAKKIEILKRIKQQGMGGIMGGLRQSLKVIIVFIISH